MHIESDYIVYHLRKLSALYDTDGTDAAASFQGELLDEYRKALRAEQRELDRIIQLAYRTQF